MDRHRKTTDEAEEAWHAAATNLKESEATLREAKAARTHAEKAYREAEATCFQAEFNYHASQTAYEVAQSALLEATVGSDEEQGSQSSNVHMHKFQLYDESATIARKQKSSTRKVNTEPADELEAKRQKKLEKRKVRKAKKLAREKEYYAAEHARKQSQEGDQRRWNEDRSIKPAVAGVNPRVLTKSQRKRLMEEYGDVMDAEDYEKYRGGDVYSRLGGGYAQDLFGGSGGPELFMGDPRDREVAEIMGMNPYAMGGF